MVALRDERTQHAPLPLPSSSRNEIRCTVRMRSTLAEIPGCAGFQDQSLPPGKRSSARIRRALRGPKTNGSRFGSPPRDSGGREKFACIRSVISRIETARLGPLPQIRSRGLGCGKVPVCCCKIGQKGQAAAANQALKSGLDPREGGVKIIYDALIGGALGQRPGGGRTLIRVDRRFSKKRQEWLIG